MLSVSYFSSNNYTAIRNNPFLATLTSLTIITGSFFSCYLLRFLSLILALHTTYCSFGQSLQKRSFAATFFFWDWAYLRMSLCCLLYNWLDVVHYPWIAAYPFHRNCHHIVIWHCSLQWKKPKLVCCLKMTYFSAWKLAEFFFSPYSFTFLWNYVMLFLLLLIFAWDFGCTFCNVFSSVIYFLLFSLSIDFDPFVCLFFTFGNPFYLEIRFPNLTSL